MRHVVQKAENQAHSALLYSAATALQRVWRGHAARKKADNLKIELAEYVQQLRQREAKEEEARDCSLDGWNVLLTVCAGRLLANTYDQAVEAQFGSQVTQEGRCGEGIVANLVQRR